MATYDPVRQSTVLYEEEQYQVSAVRSHITIWNNRTMRASSCLKMEPIPEALERKLIARGYNPADYFYVPYILVRASAKASFEEFVASLQEETKKAYVRSVLPSRNQ